MAIWIAAIRLPRPRDILRSLMVASCALTRCRSQGRQGNYEERKSAGNIGRSSAYLRMAYLASHLSYLFAGMAFLSRLFSGTGFSPRPTGIILPQLSHVGPIDPAVFHRGNIFFLGWNPAV